MPARTKSITPCTGAFVITNGQFTQVYPKINHGQHCAAEFLTEFCQDVGIPANLKSDLVAKEFHGQHSEFYRFAKKRQINLTWAEAEQTNQVYAVDLEIRELKKRWHCKMVAKQVPKQMWDFGLQHSAKIMQLIPCSSPSNRTGYELVTGRRTPDISELCDFDFWDLVWYHTGKHPSVSAENRALGQWAGDSHQIGSDLLDHACLWHPYQ